MPPKTDADLEKKMLNAIKELGTKFDEKMTRMEENIQQKFEKHVKNIKDELERQWKAKEEECEQERQNWKNERENLLDRVMKLEWDREKGEREKRKLNIVIKGEEFTEENIKEKVEEYLKDSINTDVKVEKTFTINNNNREKRYKMTIAKLENWQMKKQVMMNKANLKRGIYIDDDLKRKREKYSDI
ncbi:cilia- and flagella-associated protein 251-like [Phymastichus coffea]|uniref:cilia- and flagella-associated protein 251-like n=1 Tax=Phymastichus coffea TaxID=108790 RepID=UPI00273BE79E|nr:cilia- and flagella-associated protein 251-like [Phymastichus coffea]